jgi:hypothetical protein
MSGFSVRYVKTGRVRGIDFLICERTRKAGDMFRYLKLVRGRLMMYRLLSRGITIKCPQVGVCRGVRDE